jgi:hypothetical protein
MASTGLGCSAGLEVSASRGSITTSFGRPPDRILAQLDAGNVRLTVPACTYAVDATAAKNAGPRHCGRRHRPRPVSSRLASPRKISAHISRGNIHILQR